MSTKRLSFIHSKQGESGHPIGVEFELMDDSKMIVHTFSGKDSHYHNLYYEDLQLLFKFLKGVVR